MIDEINDYDCLWSARLSHDDDQFLRDLQLEHELPSRSATLRSAVRFMCKYLPMVLEQASGEVEQKSKARMDLINAKREIIQHDEVMAELKLCVKKAEQSSDDKMRERLLTAAKAYAECYNVTWPLLNINDDID
jgi:hypothetical protein